MKAKKTIASVMAAMLLATNFCAFNASAEFVETEKGTVYELEDGTYATGFKKIGDYSYYFNKNGIMKKGWVKGSNGKLYYFDKEGHQIFGKVKIGGVEYDFGKNGRIENSEDYGIPKGLTPTEYKKLKKEKETLVSKNVEYAQENEELSYDIKTYEYYKDSYYEVYQEYKEYYDEAVADAKVKSASNTRLVYSGNGSWSTKTDDYNDDYYVKEWKKLKDKAEKKYKTYKKKYDEIKNKMTSNENKIKKNKERIEQIEELID